MQPQPDEEKIAWTMTVSRNGQVSIPAPVRARWQTDKVVVIDMGDRIVMRPKSDRLDAIHRLRGAAKGRMPSTAELRRQARTHEP